MSRTTNRFRAAVAAAGILWTLPAAAQTYGADYYVSPVNFAITMAGNVGEIRADHFHTGIDIKALQGVGSPIYAAADGYISRISVSPSGYGLALYVSHPNGETSVYGHLDRFEPKIAEWVRRQQYARKSFRVDLYPSKTQFPVEKGERIASLGNSGSSAGPHLHFEIRDGAGRARNLIAQGIYKVSDRLPPEVRRVLIFEVDTVSGVPVHRLRHAVPLRRTGEGAYVPENDQPLPLSASGYIAYETIDFKDGKSNTMGVYSLRQKVDGEVNLYFALDRISFTTTRYINTFTSYAENRKAGRFSVIRAYMSPNNALGIYRTVHRRGVIAPPAAGKTKAIETEICDDAGNVSKVSFRLSRGGEVKSADVPGLPVHWDRDFSYRDSLLSVQIPQKALYESAVLFFGRDSLPEAVRIGSEEIPLQKGIDVIVAAPRIPQGLRAKALLATVDNKGKVTGSAGGSWQSEGEVSGVKANLRRFGRYTVAVDTVAPVIRPVYQSGAAIPQDKSVRFTVTDDLSGVASYSLTVDGKWELLTYDPKNRLLEHIPLRSGAASKREVVLTVSDSKNNKRTFKATYTW